jgi:hypothetical protein
VQCCAMLCNAVQCCAMLCNAVQCCAMLCNAVQSVYCHAMQMKYCAIQLNALLRSVKQYAMQKLTAKTNK